VREGERDLREIGPGPPRQCPTAVALVCLAFPMIFPIMIKRVRCFPSFMSMVQSCEISPDKYLIHVIVTNAMQFCTLCIFMFLSIFCFEEGTLFFDIKKPGIYLNTKHTKLNRRAVP